MAGDTARTEATAWVGPRDMAVSPGPGTGSVFASYLEDHTHVVSLSSCPVPGAVLGSDAIRLKGPCLLSLLLAGGGGQPIPTQLSDWCH